MISLWWGILKNAKLSGKATGTSLDASKIKINIDEGKCKEKLRKLIWFNTTEPAPNKIAQIVGRAPAKDSYLLNTPEFNELPEKTACNILQTMKSLDLNNIKDSEFRGPVLYKAFDVGEGYKVYLEVDEEDNVIRYFISNINADTAWIIFSFSDIKKWMAAL